LHALFELRRGLSAGTVMLDAEAANIAQVAGAFVVTILLLLYTSIFYVSKKEATLIFDITPYLLRHFYNF